MKREPASLDQEFDLLVVGGGIYGAWTAWDASLRGLRTALVEAADWGSATSSRSSKLLHGGLRYLERGDVGLVRKSLVERERLLRLAPHRTWPLQFVVPATPGARYRGLPLALGLWAYDTLAPGGLGERRARRWSGRDIRAAAPFLHENTASAWTYGDAGTDDGRLVLEVVDGVLRAGGAAVNGATVTVLDDHGATVTCDGRTHQVRAGATVVCGGPWAARLAGLPSGTIRLTKGVHLTLPPLPVQDPLDQKGTAFLLNHPADGRVFFLIPWYGATLVGTTDTDTQDPHEGPTEADIAYLLAGVTATCPHLGWGRRDVRCAWAGVRTLLSAQGTASSVSREWQAVQTGPRTLVSLGGKLTSARHEAEGLVDLVGQLMGRALPAAPTRQMPLPWTPRMPWADFLATAVAEGRQRGLDVAQATTAARRYGARLPELWERLDDHPEEAARPLAELPLCLADRRIGATEMQLPEGDGWDRTPLRLLTDQRPTRTG